MKESVLAVIPARGGSKGIPRKNLAPVAGRPLVWHSIRAALRSAFVDDVVLSTDDDEIAAVGRAEGVRVVTRPASLAQDTTPTEPVMRHAVEAWEETTGRRTDLVVLLQPTSPIRGDGRIDEAIEQLRSEAADSLVSACEDHAFYWHRDGDGFAASYDFRNRPRRQDIAHTTYRENGSIYVTRREILMPDGCRLGGKVTVFPMPQEESLEIDTPLDLALCRHIMDERIRHGFSGRLMKVKLVVMDMDGVLTDGRVLVGEDGRESKMFSVIDGHGIALLREREIPCAIITRERTSIAEHRARKLGIGDLYTNVRDKAAALRELVVRYEVGLENVLYIGDDLPDIPAMEIAGCAVAVATARPDVRAAAHYVTEAHGGDGAVREVVDRLMEVLDAQGDHRDEGLDNRGDRSEPSGRPGGCEGVGPHREAVRSGRRQVAEA